MPSMRLLGTAALLAVVTPLRADAQLGAFAGCTIYSCYRFTLAETSRSGPLLPFPGSPPPSYPNNVLSQLVHYRVDVTARVLPAAVTDGVITVSPFLPWFFNDGIFGDGGCCVGFGTFTFLGRAAGTELHTSSVLLGLPDMQGFVPVGAPTGTTGVTLGLSGFELFESVTIPFGINDLTLVPVVTAAPEPATFALVAGGLLGIGALARRRRR